VFVFDQSVSWRKKYTVFGAGCPGITAEYVSFEPDCDARVIDTEFSFTAANVGSSDQTIVSV
jgi:hypothetical protein